MAPVFMELLRNGALLMSNLEIRLARAMNMSKSCGSWDDLLAELVRAQADAARLDPPGRGLPRRNEAAVAAAARSRTPGNAVTGTAPSPRRRGANAESAGCASSAASPGIARE